MGGRGSVRSLIRVNRPDQTWLWRADTPPVCRSCRFVAFGQMPRCSTAQPDQKEGGFPNTADNPVMVMDAL